VLAAAEQPRHGEELDVRDRDEVVGPEEDVELGGVQPLNRLVVAREVKDCEEIVGVVVHLRPLAAREDVLTVEWMPLEALGQLADDAAVDGLEVDPAETAGAELSDARCRVQARIDLRQARPGPPDARKAGHRY